MVFGTLDPLSAVSSSINVTIKILEVTYQLKAVGEQTSDLLSTTRHVDFMVHEAHRLRRLKAGQLSASERLMIDTIISDTEDALRGVAKLVEPCRVDKDTKGGIRFGHRVMWVFRDNPSVRDKHQKLQVCHQSLTVAFSCLYSKDVVVIAPAPDGKIEEQSSPPPQVPPPPYDPQLKELLGWQKRRRGRKSLGEKESGPNENTNMLNTGSSTVSVGGSRSPSPCLLAIPIDDDTDTASLSSSFSRTTLHSSTMAAPELQRSALHNSDSPFSIATRSPNTDSHSLHTSASDSYLYSHDQTTPSISHSDAFNDHISPTHNLPELDSAPFSSMLSPYTFTDEKTKVGDEPLRRAPSSSSDQRSSSLATAPETEPFDSRSFHTPLPPAPIELPTSSPFSTGKGLGLSWLESTRHQSYNDQGPTAPSPTLGQLPLPSRTNSDGQLAGIKPFDDSSDAVTRADEVGIRENRAKSVGQGVIRRGGRSWLAYHATRSDVGNGGVDWNG